MKQNWNIDDNKYSKIEARNFWSGNSFSILVGILALIYWSSDNDVTHYEN